MKHFKKGILASLLVAVMLLPSGSTYAGDTYNQAINKVEGDSWILYWGQIAFVTDSIGNFYTRAFQIGDSNVIDGMMTLSIANVTGTEDVNVTLQYSKDKTTGNFTDGLSDSDLDQVQTTVIDDTVGTADGVVDKKFHGNLLCRIKADGQTSNPELTVLKYWVFLRKNDGASKKNLGRSITTE